MSTVFRKCTPWQQGHDSARNYFDVVSPLYSRAECSIRIAGRRQSGPADDEAVPVAVAKTESAVVAAPKRFAAVGGMAEGDSSTAIG